jgi:hypothetical protein
VQCYDYVLEARGAIDCIRCIGFSALTCISAQTAIHAAAAMHTVLRLRYAAQTLCASACSNCKAAGPQNAFLTCMEVWCDTSLCALAPLYGNVSRQFHSRHSRATAACDSSMIYCRIAFLQLLHVTFLSVSAMPLVMRLLGTVCCILARARACCNVCSCWLRLSVAYVQHFCGQAAFVQWLCMSQTDACLPACQLVG